MEDLQAENRFLKERIRDLELSESARKRDEERLRESEKRFWLITETIDEVFWMTDRDLHRILYLSPSFERVWGRSRESLYQNQRSFLDAVHPEDRERFLANLESGKNGQAFEQEYRILLPDGTLRHIWDRRFPIRNEQGSITGYAGITTDISELKRIERARNESVQLLRETLSSLHEAVLLVDTNSRVISDCNQTAEVMFGFSREELIGRTSESLHVGEASWRAFGEKVLAQLAVSDHFEFAFQMKRRDGTVFPTEHFGRPIRHGKSFHTVISVIRDLTERKRAQEEQERLRAQLVQAQKMESIGRLAGGVAHDFNNMLGVILGHSEMALDQVDILHPLHGDLQEIRKAAQRSADLTRQLLAFARKQTVMPRILDLNGTVSGMLKMLKRLIGEDIELEWNPGEGVWPVRMDPSQIDQMLANLCVNARDAIAAVGRVTISTDNSILEREEGDEAEFYSGDFVCLTVKDSGCGMTPEVRNHLFEPFFTTKEVGKGTGLGLATVYGIIRQNGGFIRVDSEPGLGTSFRLFMPRFSARVEPVSRENTEKKLLQGCETVLLVEDEPGLLKMGGLMLQKLGYRVLAAGSPEEAERLAEAHPGEVMLLITDVVMPQMNGRDLAKKLTSVHPQLKCLLMSGHSADILSQAGSREAEVHFVQKPFSIRILAEKIREVLDAAP